MALACAKLSDQTRLGLFAWATIISRKISSIILRAVVGRCAHFNRSDSNSIRGKSECRSEVAMNIAPHVGSIACCPLAYGEWIRERSTQFPNASIGLGKSWLPARWPIRSCREVSSTGFDTPEPVLAASHHAVVIALTTSCGPLSRNFGSQW